MLAELRTKSQITIPKEIIKALGLSVGDKFDIYEKDGVICLMPVVTYPKKYVEDLRSELLMVKESIDNGEMPVFNNVDELFEDLERH